MNIQKCTFETIPITGIFFGLISLFILQAGIAQGQHSVQGTIHQVPKNTANSDAVIRLFLLDEDSFERPYTGIRQKVLRVKPGKSSLDFSINHVETGTYGLRCYLDENNNGKLDRFMVIPQEPWCLSWKNNNKTIPPGFDDISFRVDTDTHVNLFLDD